MTDQRDDIGAKPAAASGGELLELVRALRRNGIWIALIAVLGLLAAAGLSAIQTPKYTAKVTVALAPRKDLVGQDNANTDQAPPDTAVDTQVEALKSPDLVADVATSLGLDKDPEFSKPHAGQVLDPTAKSRKLVALLETKLKVRRVGQTLITEVSFTSVDPKKAATIANAVVQAFVQKQIAQKFTDAQTSSQLINSQIDALRQKVVAAQAAVENYRAEHNLLTAAGTPLTEQELSTLDQQLATSKADEAEATARLNVARQQAQQGSNGEDVGAALGSLVVADLRHVKRAEVSRHVVELQQKYGPLHPDLVIAKQQLADTDKQIKAEVSRIMSNLEAQVTAAHERRASIEASMASARAELVNNNAASVTLNQLQSNADASNALYQAVLARAKEASAQQSFAESDVRVDSPATTPVKPSSPIWPLNLALGLVLGLAIGVGLAVLRERMEAGLSDMEEVEGLLGVPYIAGVPTVASSVKKGANKNPIVALREHPFSSFAEAFRTIDTTVRHSTASRVVKVIAVTSALPGEGKTTTAICLGEVMNLSGNRVVLVDCDLRRRSVNAALNIRPDVGLTEVLTGKATLQEALVHDEATGLTILPLTPGSHLSGAKFDSIEMDTVLDALRASFDVIVLDTAPVLPVVDTRVLAQKADAVVLLARWRKTPWHATRTALRLLSDFGVEVFGVVLSQIDVKAQARYGKGDAAHYYKAYQGYYTE